MGKYTRKEWANKCGMNLHRSKEHLLMHGLKTVGMIIKQLSKRDTLPQQRRTQKRTLLKNME